MGISPTYVRQSKSLSPVLYASAYRCCQGPEFLGPIGEKEFEDLKREKQEVTGLLKTTQERYLLKGQISQSKFTGEHEAHRSRLVEIEMEEDILKKRIRKEKGKRRVGALLNGVYSLKKSRLTKGKKKNLNKNKNIKVKRRKKRK